MIVRIHGEKVIGVSSLKNLDQWGYDHFDAQCFENGYDILADQVVVISGKEAVTYGAAVCGRGRMAI